MLTTLVMIGACAPGAPTHADEFQPNVLGLQVFVPEIAPAAAFYRTALGFEVEGFVGQEAAWLGSGSVRMWLARQGGPVPADEEAYVNLNFRVPDLDLASEAVRAAGGQVGESVAFPLGHYRQARDPWGNRFELLHVGDSDSDAPTVFNVSVTTTGFEVSEPYMELLGFQVFSRDYLPTALPYKTAGATPLVTHPSATRTADSAGRHSALLLEVEDLDGALNALREASVFETHPVVRPSVYGRIATLRSPSGLPFRLIERSPAQLTFERFRALTGTWNGKSTQGWEAEIEFEVIARGTVVLQRSNFAAHPNETMLTAFHRDGARLVLTHYCVAGNQPRLELARVEGDELDFNFADSTNLASRDVGHMDSVRYQFRGPNAFQSRWSWYQRGEERWMEEIRYVRAE